jgi:hypothetical protein
MPKFLCASRCNNNWFRSIFLRGVVTLKKFCAFYVLYFFSVSILAPSVSAWLSIRSIKSGPDTSLKPDSSLFFCYECIPSIFVFSNITVKAISLGVNNSGKTSCSTTYYEYIIYFSVGYFIDISNLVSVALSGLGRLYHWIKWLGWFFSIISIHHKFTLPQLFQHLWIQN